MRQINLNGVSYEIKGEIIKRAISPWIAKVSSGSKEYSDFSQADLEEYYDFRNGVGKTRGVGSDARLQFSEGIDFTTEGQAVLAPLINTAGTFGVAPVKIIDFQDKTYGIGSSKISIWTTSPAARTITLRPDGEGSSTDLTPSAGDNYECVDETSANGDTDYVSLTNDDGYDLYDIDSRTEGSGTINYVKVYVNGKYITNVAHIYCSLKTEGEVTVGTAQELTTDYAAYSQTWTTNPETEAAWTWTQIDALEIGVYLNTGTPDSTARCTQVYVEVNYTPTANDWHLIYNGLASPVDAIVVTDSTDQYLVVSSATAAVYTTDGLTWSTLSTVKGYLAFYDTKLYGITTDGGTLYYSAANNIDGAGGNSSLSGNFGTIYDLFEGKLLADGTPILYMCGTEGLFTIDTTNEKAYKQEVEYPPLTYSGHVGKYWNSYVWVSTGYGILKVTPSMATEIGPNLDDGLPSTYHGYVYDMETVNNWLIYCTKNASSTDKSSIFKRNSSYGGSLQIYTSAVNTAITCLHHSPSSLYTNGRLWFGEGTSVKYMMFPDTTSNVKQISTYQYVDDSGYGTFPIFRKLAAIPKVALGVALITKSCNTNEYVQVFYGLNGAAATTSLGTYKSSPRPTIVTFGSGLGTEFYTIQFAVKLFRGSTNTNSPELESLLFYWMARPATISSWTFNVVCEDENAEATIDAFETLRDTKTLMAFYPTGDTDKDSYNVALSNMPLRYYVENQQNRKGTIQVTLEQIFEG